MLSTSHAVNSPAACGRCRSSDAPTRTTTFFPRPDTARRGGPLRCSARASGANTIGCLEAEPSWGGGAPVPALALPAGLKVAAPAPGDDAASPVPSEQRVREVVLKQAALTAARPRTAAVSGGLEDAFDRCGEVCKEYAKTFYLGKRENIF